VILPALVLASALGHAAFWASAADPVAEPSRLFDAGQFAGVVSSLSPEALQRLRGDGLRRAYFLLASSLQRLGRADQAIGVYQLGVKLYPADLNLLTGLAGVLHGAGLEDRARPLFEKVISIHPNNAVANLGLAEIDYSLGFLDRSARHYEKALETDDSKPEMWIAYGDVLHELRDDKTAELAYRRSLQLRPSPAATLGLAFALRGDGRAADGIAALRALLESDPDLERRAQGRSLLGLWLLEERREDEALAAVEPLLSEAPDDPLGRYIRARVRLRQDRYRDAVADLKVAAQGGRYAPFVAQVAQAMLERLKGGR